MITLINDLANFGRGRDKQPRKKRNVLIGTIGAIGGSAIGAGIGYATKPSKYKLTGIKRYKDVEKSFNKTIKDQLDNANTYDNTKDYWQNNADRKKKELEEFKANKNKVIKGYAQHTKASETLGDFDFMHNQKQLDRFGKLSNKIGSKRALIGSGVGLAAGLGGAYLYNRLKNDNSK